MACDESLIYSPIVICKQILDVQAYGTSCLFSLSALQFEAQMGISIGWKQEPWRGEVCFFGTLYKHITAPLKQALLERNKENMCKVFPWCLGMLFINSRGHEEAMKSRQLKLKLPLLWITALDHCSGLKLGPWTVLLHCVTSAFGRTALRSTLRRAYYSLCACACVTYLFTAGRNEKRP